VYKPGMKVLCIVSGEHMPSDYNLIDFGRAVETMRKVSGLPARNKGPGRAIDHDGREGRGRVGLRA
jgi:hypothetical protein